MSAPPPAPKADRKDAQAVRELLRRSGFARAGIQELLGVAGDLLMRKQERPVYERRLAGEGALETLIRLFLLDAGVDGGTAERALGTDGLEPLLALGLAAESEGEVHGRVRLVPHGEVLVASDVPDPDGGSPDFVAGVHRPSVTLAELTVRLPVARALDMATGCGIQAILASERSERVVATDVNERCLAFAELNAALNGIDTIDFRSGSFFEPVEGETFDLVVANPPYVISPESAYLFRDSGLGRDRVSELLVGELPSFLEPGGFGTIMASWIQEGDDPARRPASWLEGRGCDAWILHTGVDDPLTTSASWNRDLEEDEAAYAEAIDRWREYFAAEKIEALAYGAIVVRRREGANWQRSRELPNEPRVEPADHVLRLFTGVDAAEALDDAGIAAARIALVPGALIERRVRREADGWSEAATLLTTIGIPFSATIDGFTATFLLHLDGERTFGEIGTELAEAFDAPTEQLLASGAPILRELLELGLAEVVSEG